MWGRELRAGLVFVLVSVTAGGVFRAWERGHEERLADIVLALSEVDAASAPGAPPGDSPGGAGSRAPVGQALPERGAGASSGGRASRARRPDAAPPRPASIDADRASEGEWLRLPGIGPALAARIVADRAALGPFGGPDGLLRVPGIGPKTLARIRVYLAAPADSTAAGGTTGRPDRAE